MAKAKRDLIVKGRLAQSLGAQAKPPGPAVPPAAAPGATPAVSLPSTSPVPAVPAVTATASVRPADLFVGTTRMIKIALLTRDDSTQGRVKINPAIVDEYAEALERGAKFPAVTVFFDGTKHWVADGFHRIEAHLEAKRDEIAAEINSGTHEDAILYAAGPANARHGLRRSSADKRRSIEMVLVFPSWWAKSDRAIADHCHVTDKTVASVRREILAAKGPADAPNEREGRDGRVRRIPAKSSVSASDGLARLESVLPAAGVGPADGHPLSPTTAPSPDDHDTSLRSAPGGQLSDIGLKVTGEGDRQVAKVATAAPAGGAVSAELRAALETTMDTLDMLMVAIPPGAHLELRTWAEEGRRLAQAHLAAITK